MQNEIAALNQFDVQESDGFSNIERDHEQCDIDEEFYLSRNTSITRKAPTAPLKKLLALNAIKGRAINFAKGKDKVSMDTLAIAEATGRSCLEHDINWFNNPEALLCTYDSVWCAYCCKNNHKLILLNHTLK
jgi:hypothetical protein